MSLVAAYGESSDEEEPADEDEDDDDGRKPDSVKLPKPNFDESSSTNSVFVNPFVEAENVNKAILERHVKMVPTIDKVQAINGKKICWNYRKGRCRFGHTCTFAHDSDLYQHKPQAHDKGENCTKQKELNQQKNIKSKMKRPGLSDGIIPSKRVMKMYKQQNN